LLGKSPLAVGTLMSGMNSDLQQFIVRITNKSTNKCKKIFMATQVGPKLILLYLLFESIAMPRIKLLRISIPVAACQWKLCPVMQLDLKSKNDGYKPVIYGSLEEGYPMEQCVSCLITGFLSLYSLYCNPSLDSHN
jgi:hypothetical protein